MNKFVFGFLMGAAWAYVGPGSGVVATWIYNQHVKAARAREL